MDAWYGLAMTREARAFSKPESKAHWSILCFRHAGVPPVAGQAVRLQRAMQGSEVLENVPVSAAGATPEVGPSLLQLGLVLTWGRGGPAATGSSARARQLLAGNLLAAKHQNFICLCQVKTERMINGDQINR